MDRSAAYATRYIAKNLVAAGVAEEVLVQVSYAIGIAKPVSIFVNTFGTALVPYSDAEIAEKISKIFNLTPGAIEKDLGLRNPIYAETAAYGHMGRKPEKVKKYFQTKYDAVPIEKEVELFTWEKTDKVPEIKKAFNLK